MNSIKQTKEKMIVGSDYRLPYFEFGSGEKNFILLPGASMTSILDSEAVVKVLFAPYAEDFHIYVFDVPQDLEAVAGIGRLADIIADASGTLGISEADVYGASMGGMIAQTLAIRYPKLVRSLTIASSMSRNSELGRKVIAEWSEISDPAELARKMNAHVYSEAFRKANADAFLALESSADEDGVKRLHDLTRMITDFSVYDELDKIKCPVYVFAGSCDNTLGVSASVEIAKKLNCSIKVYEGCSHAVYDEYPGFYDGVFANLKR